ncbi:MAG: YicC/YloC family endoribonuclease [Lentimicrobium sp.]|jgi:uncharacterized protein (TIGR00255 family)|nr:YicC/YloC family endoribonuclease [Lentimicrobium sp.]
MLKSMTGFGKSSTTLAGKTLTFEIRSLNSKQLDLNLRFPSLLRDLEPEIRAMVTRSAERGKIELLASIDFTGSELPANINKPLAIAYYRELKSLAEELQAPAENLLSIVMKMPEITKNSREELSDEEKISAKATVNEALQLFDEFRKHEGQLLENDFIDRINAILANLEGITPYEEQRNIQMREKLRSGFAGFNENNNFDANRFEQEIIYYLEKLDITEEKVRLRKHCDYFLDTLKETVANGRKLSFVSQEIGREINTIGSKASDANIQKIVVGMKDELEKIKEQLANIL